MRIEFWCAMQDPVLRGSQTGSARPVVVKGTRPPWISISCMFRLPVSTIEAMTALWASAPRQSMKRV